MYADYEFYVSCYYGTMIAEDDFCPLAKRASEFIDYITGNQAHKAFAGTDEAKIKAIRKCCCALAEQYVTIDRMKEAAAATFQSGGEIQSETVGSHSRTFRSGTETSAAVAAANGQLGVLARHYLCPVGLLYRGGVSGVCSSCCNDL